MSVKPILAENIPPIVLIFFLVPLLLAILALFTLRRLVAAGTSSPRIQSVITRSLILVLGGGLFLFFLLTVRGGAPASFYVLSAFPLVAGLCSLYLLGRKTPEASRPVAVTFRVLLYGGLALAVVVLCVKLLAK